MDTEKPVDAIITWVDGTELTHQNKLTQYLKTKGIERNEFAHPTRYNQCGELEYCIASIMQNAPWIRNIYIVTDQQRPSILERLTQGEWAQRIKLVDHKEIFQGFERFLPTFNSMSIEMMLWRIKGLSERFIYFNDDCLLIRPVKYSDFFQADKVVLRGQWKWMRTAGFKEPTFYRSVQQRSARQIGYKWWYFRVTHIPFPLLKSVLADYFTQHADILAENIQYPLRNDHQLWMIALAQHILLKKRRAVINNALTSVQIHPDFHSREKIEHRLKQAKHKKHIHFLCIQSLDLASPEFRDWIFKWVDMQLTNGNKKIL
jgi:hypothetical protein